MDLSFSVFSFSISILSNSYYLHNRPNKYIYICMYYTFVTYPLSYLFMYQKHTSTHIYIMQVQVFWGYYIKPSILRLENIEILPFQHSPWYNGCSPDKGIALSSQMIYLADISILHIHIVYIFSCVYTFTVVFSGIAMDHCTKRGVLFDASFGIFSRAYPILDSLDLAAAEKKTNTVPNAG